MYCPVAVIGMGQKERVDPLGLAVAGQTAAERGYSRVAEAADIGQVEQRGHWRFAISARQ